MSHTGEGELKIKIKLTTWITFKFGTGNCPMQTHKFSVTDKLMFYSDISADIFQQNLSSANHSISLVPSMQLIC